MNVSVHQAHKSSKKKNHKILDVRTSSEWLEGIPQNAICLDINDLESTASKKLSKSITYYVICRSGRRSEIAINKLINLGFRLIYHINKGYQAWLKAQLPIDYPKVTDNDVRYARHHQLSGFGRQAQNKLLDSHVLLIGSGGLGSSAAMYLVAAGVGQLTIIDPDVVELSNLQRQIIHENESIGSLKVNSAKKRLIGLNPNIKVNAIAEKIHDDNAYDLIKSADVVIDGSDNLKTRYLINKVCLSLSKPLVYAAVYQYESQLSVFDFRDKNSACLCCLFPETKGFEPANCSTEGVLGVVPGLAGIMQASETIKLITNVGEILQNRLLIMDLSDNSSRQIKYSKSPQCKLH